MRAFHREISAAGAVWNPCFVRGFRHRRNETRAYGKGERDVGHKSSAEKALFPRMGAVDELVREYKVPGWKIFFQRTACRHRNDVGTSRALQRIDIGAIID